MNKPSTLARKILDLLSLAETEGLLKISDMRRQKAAMFLADGLRDWYATSSPVLEGRTDYELDPNLLYQDSVDTSGL